MGFCGEEGGNRVRVRGGFERGGLVGLRRERGFKEGFGVVFEGGGRREKGVVLEVRWAERCG